MKERELIKLEEKHASEAEFLRVERDKIQKRKTWRCINCNKRTQITKLTIVREFWHTTATGCTGGDYWNPSDEYWIDCPKCGIINRVCDTFVQIRKPWKHINESRTHDFISKNTRFCNEFLKWYPRGCETGMGGITHKIIERLRKE